MRRIAIRLALTWGLIATGPAWGQFGGDGPPRTPSGPARADLICEVEGPVTILKLLPSGEAVKKGDVVCELDAADLRDRLSEAEIAIKRAEAARESERKLVEASELAARAFSEAEYPMEVQRAEARIRLAEGALLLAQQGLEAKARASGGEASVPSRERLELMRREFELREARTAEKVLKQYTRDRRVKQLQAAVERGRATVWVAEAALAKENSRAETLRRQIAACVVRAPRDGVFRVGPSLNLREGGSVRARQLLGWIVTPEAGPAAAATLR